MPLITLSSIPAPTDGNWLLVATARYEAQYSTTGNSDWGSSYGVSLYMQQTGATSSGLFPVTNTRLPYQIQYAFTVISGVAITLSLNGYAGAGSVSIEAWNIYLEAELIKR